MNAKTKIRPDSIELAQRTLDALPEHRPEELTKTQAIQRLIVPIRATQSKGYSLAAIGRMLSDCGIPITTGALRAYVSEASSAGGKKKRRHTAKLAARAPQGAQASTPSSHPKASPAQPTPGAKPNVAAATPLVDLEWESATRSDKATSPSGLRASFPVLADTEDL